MKNFEEGNRKLCLVYIFGFLGAAVYVFSVRTIAEMTALFGFWIGLIGWYNQSNLAEHKIKEDETNYETK